MSIVRLLPDRNSLLEAVKIVSEAMRTMKNDGMDEKYPIGLIDIDLWEWPQGVGLYGLLQYAEHMKDPGTLRYLFNWYDLRMCEGLPERNVNTCSPLIVLIALAEKTGRADYITVCDEWSRWIMEGLIRTGEDRAFQHMITGDANDGQILIDTLFMSVQFLAKAGLYFNRPEYVEEAKKQYLIHIKYLYNKHTGLFYHGWDFNAGHNYGAVQWGRGNGWFTCGVVDFLETVPVEAGVKGYLLDTLRSQARALAGLQHESGLWHTVLDDPTSYVEASATAAFGYGLLKGVRLGFIDESYKEHGIRAVNAVLEHIDSRGVVHRVSYGTPVGDSVQFYKDIPVTPMTYGQSMTLLLLIEAMKHSE